MAERYRYGGHVVTKANGAQVGDLVLCGEVYVPVLEIRRYAPGTAPAHAPIKKDWTAVELVTERGSRWYGEKEN